MQAYHSDLSNGQWQIISDNDWTSHYIEYAEHHLKCRLWFQMNSVVLFRNL